MDTEKLVLHRHHHSARLVQEFLVGMPRLPVFGGAALAATGICRHWYPPSLSPLAWRVSHHLELSEVVVMTMMLHQLRHGRQDNHATNHAW
jgi:hypothetical protein